MSLDANTGEFISLSEAQDYVKCFRSKFPILPKGFFAGSEKIKTILNQEDCIGIRVYYGFDIKTLEANLVILGVDSNEKDISSGYILEKTVPCPNTCDVSSPLFNP